MLSAFAGDKAAASAYRLLRSGDRDVLVDILGVLCHKEDGRYTVCKSGMAGANDRQVGAGAAGAQRNKRERVHEDDVDREENDPEEEKGKEEEEEEHVVVSRDPALAPLARAMLVIAMTDPRFTKLIKSFARDDASRLVMRRDVATRLLKTCCGRRKGARVNGPRKTGPGFMSVHRSGSMGRSISGGGQGGAKGWSDSINDWRMPVLGHGRIGTRVFKAAMLPQHFGVCAWTYGQSDAKCTIDTSLRARQDLVIKYIPDESDALLESDIHNIIHRWFKQTGDTHLTILHPKYRCADVTNASGKKYRVIFYRLMQGDVSRLRMSSADILNMARAVLAGLVVFHKHNMLHCDIKPNNIMFRYVDPADRTKGIEFALGDYGFITPVDVVLDNLITGGSPSGTDGFISPLLLQHSDAYLETRFESVAVRSAAFKRRINWNAYFERNRAAIEADESGRRLAKTDIHSLALTMLVLMEDNGLGGDPALLRFVARLMFFRPGDFTTAGAALRAIK